MQVLRVTSGAVIVLSARIATERTFQGPESQHTSPRGVFGI